MALVIPLKKKKPTYNVVTKVYTDESGNKYSMASAPKGSTLVFSSGGGSSNTGTSSSSGSSPPDNSNSNVPVVASAPPPVKSAPTDAQLIEQKRQQYVSIQKEAGVYGKGYGEAKARYEIKKYYDNKDIKDKERLRNLEKRGYTIQSTPTGYIANPPQQTKPNILTDRYTGGSYDVSTSTYSPPKSVSTIIGVPSSDLRESRSINNLPLDTSIKLVPSAPEVSVTSNISKTTKVEKFVRGATGKGGIVGIGIPNTEAWIPASDIVQFNREKTPKLMGVGVFGTPFFISREQIREEQYLAKAGKFVALSNTSPLNPSLIKTDRGSIGYFAGGVAEELVPYTAGGVVLTAGAVYLGAYGNFPTRLTISSGATAFGIAGVFNKNATPQQKVASGIVGGLGSMGLVIESIPFLRGIKYRFSKDYKYTKVQTEGFKAVELKRGPLTYYYEGLSKPYEVNLTGGGKSTPITKEINYRDMERIGIIPEGSPNAQAVELPKTSALVRGGFKSPPSEKYIYLNREQTVATSQIGFFQEGKKTILDREFFVTPEEPNINIPVTRKSRLGLTELRKTPDPSNVQISFGLKGPSQIGIEEGAFITRTGKGNSYKIGTGTELEAIKGAGTIITDVTKTGVTVIDYQGVQLYSFKTTSSKSPIIETATLYPTRVQGESLLAIGGSDLTKNKASTNINTASRTITTASKTNTFININSSRTISKTMRGGSNAISTSSPIQSLNYPKSYPSITTGSIKTNSSTKNYISPSPKTYSRYYFKTPSITTPTTTRNYPTYTPVNPKPTAGFFKTKASKDKKGFGFFTVYLRRFGKFKPIGQTKNIDDAFNLGTEKATTTLGATFKVTGSRVNYKTPAGFYAKQTKEGTLFIEEPKYRLSTNPELKEIQYYKKLKGGTM